MSETLHFELLLREALTPVDPPEDLVARLEDTLTNLAEIAADELEAWELSAMRDPRNWLRPAAAVVVGGSAGAALVVLRARQRQQQRAAEAHGVRDLAERTLRDVAHGARRLLDR
ncbi:MAG TPA: hypothetical protein VGN69_06110 [Solirubrobacteraceae bacterium]|jgi:hypothetical protein|nr:hypothetical protein [Solirubrobacteraceae bacterium]